MSSTDARLVAVAAGIAACLDAGVLTVEQVLKATLSAPLDDAGVARWMALAMHLEQKAKQPALLRWRDWWLKLFSSSDTQKRGLLGMLL